MSKPTTEGSHYLQALIRHAAADAAVEAAYVGGPLAAGGADPYGELELHLAAPAEFRAGLTGWLGGLGETALLEPTPAGCRVVTPDGLQIEIIVSDRVAPTGLQAVFQRNVGSAPTTPALEQVHDLALEAAACYGAIYRAAAALGRGLSLTAHGELEQARERLVNLYRLALSPGNPGRGWAGADRLPGGAKALAGVREWLVCPLELQAQWRCAHRLATTYESLVLPLTERLGLPYPWAMRNLVFHRLEQVKTAWANAEAEARGEVPVTKAPEPAPEPPPARTGPARFKVKSRHIT